MIQDNLFSKTWKLTCKDCKKEHLWFKKCTCMVNKYIERLAKEWLEHGKIIVAVDFDSTISYWPTIDNKEDIERTIDLLQMAYQTGAVIVINTCSNLDRYADIQEHCEKLKIPISAINANAIDLPYGKTGKVYANIYLDDRAGLLQALSYLEQAMYIVRGKQATNLTLGEQC